MIPTTNVSADIQAIVHHKSSVFTLIVVNPTKRSVQILMPQRRGAEWPRSHKPISAFRLLDSAHWPAPRPEHAQRLNSPAARTFDAAKLARQKEGQPHRPRANFRALHVVEVLDHLVLNRGKPKPIRVDTARSSPDDCLISGPI